MANIICGSLIFSIWSVILFFGKNIGFSMLLFIAPFTYFLIYILEKNNENKHTFIKIITTNQNTQLHSKMRWVVCNFLPVI